MAYSNANRKEAIILAIDIGKNSSQQDSDGKTYFEKSIYCASMIIKRKILTKSEDHLALILFGSSHTINHLSSQGGCYGNIETVAGLGVPTWDLFNRVNSLSPTNITPSDWISTFVLAADMLRNETENKSFTGLQIIMFSNLATDISFDNIDIIATCLKMENINLSILGKDCEAISLNPASDVFIKKTEATAVNFDLILPKLSYYKQKKVMARSWNAPLIFGKVFDIKVYGYEKIDITTKSSNWLFSKNYDTQDLTTANKKQTDENGEQMEVDNELLKMINDFFPGDEMEPFIDTDEGIFVVSGNSYLQVLGFAKTTNTQSSFLIDGGSYIFKPHKTDIIAFNAIFDSMVEREEVMIVRNVNLYINLLNIGALFPQKEENEKFFVYVSLPYHAENLCTYELPPLEPIEAYLKIKSDVIHTDRMDVDIDGNKFVMPENKYDLKLQSLYDCIVEQILTKIIPEKIQCSINPPTSLIEPHFSEFMKRLPFKQEDFENYPAEDSNAIQFGHDEELDVSDELINSSKRSIENAEPALNEFKKTFSVKQEVLEYDPAEEINTVQFGHDNELDVSDELINPPISFIKNAEPPLNEFKKTFSVKQEVLEYDPAEEINTVQFGHDNELDISDELINPPMSFIETAEPPLNEFNTTFLIKQEVMEYDPAEDSNAIQFGHDEELDVSGELINSAKRSIKNAEPPLNEFKKTFSVKQEVLEYDPAEEINTVQFGHDNELDISDELINPPMSFIENAEPTLNEFNTTFLIKQEVMEYDSAEDSNAIQFGHDEELDVSDELINSAKRSIENAEPALNEFKKTFSVKQEVLEYDPAEEIKNAEPPLNEFKTTFSLKQEVFENYPAEDSNAIQFGHDEELDVSDELINSPKSSIENAEPALNEFKKTFSVKQEVLEYYPSEDSNAIQFGHDEELDVSKQCVMTPLNPIEDFINLLKSGFDSAIVCKRMHDVTLNLIEFSKSLEDLMKPIVILKALRQYNIINNDAKSYNDFMHLAKDTLLMSGKEDMWSNFINSGIGLITNEETEASDISQESSEEFMTLSGDFDIDFNIG